MQQRDVPERFAALRPFIADWALGSEEDRYRKLHASTITQLRTFYDVVMAQLPEMLEYLKKCPLNGMPPDAQTLFDLAMTFAETAHPIDLKWKDVDFAGAYDWRKMEFRTVSRSAETAAAQGDRFSMHT